MKKIIALLLLLVFSDEAITKSSDIADLSDALREATGKIEELEKVVAEIQKKVSFIEDLFKKKAQEDIAQKEIEVIAKKSPEEILKTARDLLEENNYDEARRLLDAFVVKNPGHVYCGMMLFYIGNSYFTERDYENAAIKYMKGFKANPKGTKAAETLYKLALCFKQLQEKSKCKSTLQKIINDYPGEFEKRALSEIKKIS